MLKKILIGLEEVKVGLVTLDQRMDGLDQRMDYLNKNQVKFIEENRELRLEYNTRDRIARERHEEIINRLTNIARDVDINWDMGTSNRREIERIKKQVYGTGQ